MTQNRGITDVSKEIREIENKKEELQRKQKLWNEYKDHWTYLQKQEEQLLEEVAYISQRTVSEKQALKQLDYMSEEQREVNNYFESIDESFSQEKKKLATTEEELTFEYYELRKKEETDDEI